MKKAWAGKLGVILAMCLLCGSFVGCEKTKGESKVEKETLVSLGLCFTEGQFVNRTEEAVKQRCADYVSLGVKTMRYETSWASLSKGDWIMSGETEYTLRAAVDAGLRLKLISPTIMMPQSWVTMEPDSTLVDANGMKSVNTISYWYDGIYEYTEDAINSQLEIYKEKGFLDSIDALVVDMGPAGEPLYPAAWTQTGNLENPNNEATSLWFYGENATADFREKMIEKYGSIQAVNEAWGTSFGSMEDYEMPKSGTVKGKQWEDILTWYLESKHVFIEKQIQIFKEAVKKYSDGRIQLILYMPGASFTQAEWKQHVAAGTASFAMQIGCDNEFIADMAYKYGCLLQFTGLPAPRALKQVRQYMYENGYGDIPVFGENYADYASSNDPVALYDEIAELHLAGIDYTFSKFLYEDDGLTHSSIYPLMEKALPKIQKFISNADFSDVPDTLSLEKPAPEGDALVMKVKLNGNLQGDVGQFYFSIDNLNYEIQKGDVLEYDVKLSVPACGYGYVDSDVTGSGPLRDNQYVSDQYGQSVHPQNDLSAYAGGQWMHRVIGLDISYSTYNTYYNTTGKTMSNLLLEAQPYKENGVFDYKEVIAYYDNIRITNNGEVKLVIFKEGSDFDMGNTSVQRVYGVTASVTVEKADE